MYIILINKNTYKNWWENLNSKMQHHCTYRLHQVIENQTKKFCYQTIICIGNWLEALYISLNSRPDVSAAICILSQKICSPSKEDLNELKRVVKYLKTTINYKLPLKCDDPDLSLHCYSDANFIMFGLVIFSNWMVVLLIGVMQNKKWWHYNYWHKYVSSKFNIGIWG